MVIYFSKQTRKRLIFWKKNIDFRPGRHLLDHSYNKDKTKLYSATSQESQNKRIIYNSE